MGDPPIDRRGRRLTPGERFRNWVDGVVKIWPIVLPLLGGTVWGNSETVRNTVKNWTGLAEVDGKTEIVADDNFKARVQRFSEETNAEIANLKKSIQANKRKEKADLNTVIERLERLEELVN